MKNLKQPTITSQWLTSPAFWLGWWKISRYAKPTITIFGGKHAVQDEQDYKAAFECGKLLAQADVSLLTGGGPGIMEAAMCGYASVENKKKIALGIAIANLDQNFTPVCDYKVIFMPSFAARKWLLIRYSDAFIIFPGGIGTLDELAETLNSMKFSIIKRVPIILIGKDYWRSFIEWYENACKKHYIHEDFSNLLTAVDNTAQAVEIALRVTRQKK